MTKYGLLICFSLLFSPLGLSAADIVAFPSGEIILHGVLYKPEGTGTVGSPGTELEFAL